MEVKLPEGVLWPVTRDGCPIEVGKVYSYNGETIWTVDEIRFGEGREVKVMAHVEGGIPIEYTCWQDLVPVVPDSWEKLVDDVLSVLDIQLAACQYLTRAVGAAECANCEYATADCKSVAKANFEERLSRLRRAHE